MRLSLRAKWTAVVLFIGVVPLVVTVVTALVVQRIQRDGLFRAEQELENAVVDEASRSLARSPRARRRSIGPPSSSVTRASRRRPASRSRARR